MKSRKKIEKKSPLKKREKNSPNKTPQGLWSGRFRSEMAGDMLCFSESISFDWRLYREDIEGSIAHVTMLNKIGIIKKKEREGIVRGLKKIEKEIEEGKFSWKKELEDVHMNIEGALTKVCPAGAKLHTGRSRNDQVATDMRLWLKREISRNRKAIGKLQMTMLRVCEKYEEVMLPGYTHLQRAQPILFPHHLMAYVEMLERDDGRLEDALKRIDVLPLGSGALAGSTIALDRKMVAELLGFSKISMNSMDAVSDRDFVVEYASAGALLSVHLSRLAEDLILWSSEEFGFVKLSDAYTSGSSLMPQKKNPDGAELVRGKAARTIGNLVSILTLLKGLPMTYNRDLQEDKQRLFDTADTIAASLAVSEGMIREMEVQKKRCEGACLDPLLLATDLADWMVNKGVAFREAHHAVGKLVALGEELKIPISEVPLEKLKKISKVFDKSAFAIFDLKKALEKKKVIGAPQPSQIKRRLQSQKTRLQEKLKKL